ncbi:mRNA-decapping enzyme 1B [Periplaneta americana]|uniref:mRNA-decapping enzyme 1B n=1 Tax=Periplaneta americana TaxID=6978 RepID=UPI0037E87094
MKMADAKEFRMNVSALRGVDPYVQDILETATHVALYTFNADDNEWEKTDVEGALFVYSRKGEPYHSILIMNRLNIKNLVEPVTQGLDLQLQEPFLLYRNSSCRIFGVWFYNKEECIRIASVLDKLVKESEMNKKVPDKVAVKNKRGASGGDTNVDIFTMLSKAQEDYNSNKNQANNRHLNDETKPDMPQGVVDFFAKASSGASHFSADKVPQNAHPGLFVGHHAPRTELQSDPSDNQLKPLLLQRLMSNPAHTVEHIEKQQRSVTPQSEAASTKRNKGKSQSNKDNSKQNNSGNYKSRPLSSGNMTDPMRVQHGSVLVTQPTSSTSAALVENGMSFLRISSPTTCPQLQSFFGSGLQTGVSSGMVMEAAATSDQRPVSAPLCGGMETPQKPALMPPTMFTSSATKDTSNKLDAGSTPMLAHSSNVTSVKPKPELAQSTLAPGPSGIVPLDESIVPVRPEPLTRNQLLQAFNYLVKNDPDFVNKLHEAYVKSFSEMVM